MKLTDILNHILTICNQYGRGGASGNTSVENYKARIPFLADMGQREIIEKIKFTKKHSAALMHIPEDGYRMVILPEDCGQIRAVFDADRNRLNDRSFAYREGDSLYVTNRFKGNIVIEYIPQPELIASLDSEFSLDDAAVNPALIFYIAAFLLFDQNTNRASFYQQKYEEQIKILKRRRISGVKPIADVYR